MTGPVKKPKETLFRNWTPQPFPSSSLATQSPSSGSLLAQIQSKHQSIVTHIPFLGVVASFFINRSIREEYIDAVKQRFFEGAARQNFTYQQASSIFNTQFLPFLSKCKVKDLPLFEPLLTDPAGITLTMQNLTPESKPYLSNAFTTLPMVTRLIGRLRLEDQQNYLEAWRQNAQEIDPKAFKQFVGQFTAHLKHAESLQNRRPEVFDQGSAERWALFNESLNMAQQWPDQYKRLQLYDMCVRDTTVIENRQILQYSIANVFEDTANPKNRTIPELTARTSTGGRDAPFGLFNQIGISATLPHGNENEVVHHFHPTVEVYLTDPFSMETRAVRLNLPIDENLTIGDTRKQLVLLQDFVGMPQRFASEFAKSGLPEGDKERLHQKFAHFDQELTTIFGQALGDFNSTPTRPKETSARQQPANAAGIRNPDSPAFAIESAKLRNLFLLTDGALSLIPSGPGEQHRGIGTVSQQELEQAAQVFKQEIDSTSLTIPENAAKASTLKQATLSISSHAQELIEGIPYLIVNATIQLGEKTTTYTSYYECMRIEKEPESRETPEEVKQRIIASRLFERDLLLAKATFIEQHVH